jgi:hypothetical protein
VERIHTLRQSVGRVFPAFFAAVFFFSLAAQILPEVASAVGGQVTGRSIAISSSAPSATAVTYTVNFTAFTNETHPDVIIDFCNAASDPIPGDTCSGTAGTDVPNFSAAAASGWTVTSIDSNHDIKLTTTTLSFTGGSAITPIVITGVVNPSATAGFYGRILDYANGGSSTYVSPTSLGSYVDYGGIALSTVSNISITSKVFETLSFCVYLSSASCGTPAVQSLGNTTTGALSSTGAYVNAGTAYSIATNASTGVNVVMTGTTLCRSATPSNCNTGAASIYTITSIGTTAGFTTAAVSSLGTEQFGMCEDTNSLPALVSVPAPYTDTSGTKCHGLTTGAYSGSSLFGFNDSPSTGTNSATGSQVLSSTGSIAGFTGNISFLGNIASTTEAGIYTTNLNLVATGTF